jgi:parvulin-like peptidyl-prolyl isomerase
MQARGTGGDGLASRAFFRVVSPGQGNAALGRRLLSAVVIFAATVQLVAPIAQSASVVDSVAIVNGQPLEAWELDRELAVRLSVGSYHRQISQERKTELRCESLKALVLKELKRQWAGENPVDVDEATEEAAWQEVRARFTSEGQYRAALETKGIAEDAFRLALHRDAVADAVDESIISSITSPSETEVEVYFILNSDDYMNPEARHVVHILVHVPPSATVETWQESERHARQLVEDARRESLPLLVVGESDLESLPPRFRDEVGDIGFVHRGSLLPAVDEAVFSAEVGEVIEPVKSIYGYHVLQVISTRPSQPIELAAVRAAVEERITREKRQRRLDEFELRLFDLATIEVLECVERF